MYIGVFVTLKIQTMQFLQIDETFTEV